MRGWPLIKLLPQKTNFHFVKYAKYFGILSAALSVAAIVGCFVPGLNMGIDFRGGASMEVSKPSGQVLELDQVRSAVSELGLGDVQVQGIDSAASAIVRFQIPEDEGQSAVVARVEKAT